MIRSARLRTLAAPVVLALVAQACAMQMKQEEKQAEQMSVNCATADGDLRLLRSEKAHVLEQLAMGATAIYPAGAVVGIVTGTEGTKLQVATGEYNQKLDAKIAEIQRVCGVE